MSKANPIEAPEIPPHMLDTPVSRAQKKAFAKVKRREGKEAEKPAAKKGVRKGTKRDAKEAATETPVWPAEKE